jgi:UDP-N-acetylmuramate dehydrogenase
MRLSSSTTQLSIEHNAEIPTWFHIGGRASRLAMPGSIAELTACLEIDDDFKVLGEGANLLVDDCGVSNLVVSLQTDGFRSIEIDETTGIVRAGAGVALPSLISRCVKHGLGGLEVLAGIPATVGGAAIMNAGGAFGSMSDVVIGVDAIDRAGREQSYERLQIDYDYRQSHLNHLILTQIIFQLAPGEVGEIKESLNKCMSYKSQSQPLNDKSAGCVFKNPMLVESIEGIACAGERAGAGMLIDRAGCKGLSIGGATVSDVHANFITTTKDAMAHDVIELIAQVHSRVKEAFGVSLDRELVIWGDESTEARS